MSFWPNTYIQASTIAFMKRKAIGFTIYYIVIHGIVERLCKFNDTLSFKIYKSVNPFNLAEENIIFFGKVNGSNVTFIMYRIRNKFLLISSSKKRSNSSKVKSDGTALKRSINFSLVPITIQK